MIVVGGKAQKGGFAVRTGKCTTNAVAVQKTESADAARTQIFCPRHIQW